QPPSRLGCSRLSSTRAQANRLPWDAVAKDSQIWRDTHATSMQPGEISPDEPGEGSHEWTLELKPRPENSGALALASRLLPHAKELTGRQSDAISAPELSLRADHAVRSGVAGR